MPVTDKSFVRGHDWIERVALHLLADVHEAAVAAVTDALSNPALRDRIAQLVRDEFAQREQDLIQQVFAERTGD
jgi:hypothetical protein